MKEINEGSKWCKFMDGGAHFTLYRAVGFYDIDWDFNNYHKNKKLRLILAACNYILFFDALIPSAATATTAIAWATATKYCITEIPVYVIKSYGPI